MCGSRLPSCFHACRADNTLIVYCAGHMFDGGSFRAFPENKNGGIHFVLPPEEKRNVHILNIKQTAEKNCMAHYLGFERKF